MLVDRGLENSENQAVQEEDHAIYDELGELAKYVEATTRAIRDMEAPMATTADQLPQATDFLADLSRLTEEGAHKVMTLTEQIEESRTQIKEFISDVQGEVKKNKGSINVDQFSEKIDRISKILDQDETRLMEINVALSFQDLVAQRVKKLVTILDDVQLKLLKLVVVFGLKEKEITDAKSIKNSKEERGYEMLKQLEQTRDTSLQQNLVDDILGEFGFN
jgi:chemotaxis protein CheZ